MKKGDHVFYPQQGVGLITDVGSATAFGETQAYYTIHFEPPAPHLRPLTSKVPVSRAEEIGLRPITTADEITEVFDLLAVRDVRQPANFSRRFKNYVERLASGDIYQIAEVVRNLSLRPRLSVAEKDLAVKARHQLVSEVAVACDTDYDNASSLIDLHLAGDLVV